MHYVKMLGLAAMAAAALAAFVGAGTASASEGVLCSTTTEPCTSKWPVGTVLHMTAEESFKLSTTGGITAATCTTATVETLLTANPSATGTATSPNQKITWGTGATPCTKAATTEELGGLLIQKITGTSNGNVVADSAIKVTWVGLFEGEDCNYGVKAGTSLGTITEGKPGTFDLNAVAVKMTGHSCFFGPETVKWTGKYTVTSPSATTLSVSGR